MTVDSKSALSDSGFETRKLEIGSSGGYCYVSSRRTRRPAAAAPVPALAQESAEDVDDGFEEYSVTTEIIRPDRLTAIAAPESPVRPARAEYRDPDLCSCERMGKALADKVVAVIVAGPVTLPPALLTEEAFLAGRFSVDRLDQAYDGKLWAFRYCPFEEGRLIDEQVPMPEMIDDGLVCCATMRTAVMHDRVDLPPPEKHGRASAMFVTPGKAGTIFTACPWCATSALDLCFARFKRHIASRSS